MLEAIAAELVHRSPAELADRIARNWERFRYRISLSEPIRDPVAVAIRLTRRGLDCPDIRCEDGHQLDLDATCKACDDQGPALTAPENPEEAPALADTAPADPAPPVWRPLSDAQGDSEPVAPAPARVSAVDVARYGALARALLKAHTDAEREDILARHARTA